MCSRDDAPCPRFAEQICFSKPDFLFGVCTIAEVSGFPALELVGTPNPLRLRSAHSVGQKQDVGRELAAAAHGLARGLLPEAAVGANNDGHTAATLAARSGHAAIVRLLLELGGIDANFVAWAGGPTMLHVAAFHGKGGAALGPPRVPSPGMALSRACLQT